MSRDMDLPPPPTPAEEVAWFAELRDPETPEGRHKEVRDRLIAGNVGLVWLVVFRSSEPDRLHDDLASFLTLELIRCVDKFDPSRGVRFNTYATRSLLRSARGYGQTYESVVYVPSWVIFPRKSEKERADLCRDRVAAAGQVVSFSSLLSLDGMPELFTQAPDGDADARRALAERATAEVDKLPPKQREVIRSCYGLGREPESLHEVAARTGLTYIHARSVKYHALKQIRDAVRAAPCPLSQP